MKKLIGGHKLKAQTILAFLLALWILAVATASIADGQTVYVMVDEESVLNVRINKSIASDSLFVMERGETLTMDALDDDGWASVSRAGDFGFCRVEYLIDKPPSDPIECKTMVGKLYLRNVPNGAPKRKLRKGTAVRVIGYITDMSGATWAKLKNGYIKAKYLETTEEQ